MGSFTQSRGWVGRATTALAVGVAVLALLPALASAEPGARDRTFGDNGIAGLRLEPHYGNIEFSAVSETGDGAILVSQSSIAQRYSASGVRDTSFPKQFYPAKTVSATQSDGKVLVPGEHGGLKRLLPDGSIDPSFHGGESEALPNVAAEAIAVSASGQIFVAGTNMYGPFVKSCICQIAVAHLNPDGTLDKSFGTGGIEGLTIDLKTPATDLRGLAAQSDGGVVVVAANVVLKLTAAGQLDTTYGSGGEVGPRPLRVIGFKALSGDLLELAGTLGEPSSDAGTSRFFAARYGAAGQPDPSFAGGSGVATVAVGGVAAASTALFEPDGSILVGGGSSPRSPDCEVSSGCESTATIVRWSAAGVPDPGFGEGGRVLLGGLRGEGDSFEGSGVLALTPRRGGGILAAGSGGPAGSVGFIAALTSSGALDRSFGEDGLAKERDPEPSEQIGDPLIAVGPGGKIYAADQNSAGSGYGGPSVIRYRRDGRLDPSFGDGRGFVRAGAGEEAGALAVDKAGGSVLITNSNQVYRFTAAGRVDQSFAGGKPAVLRGRSTQFRDVAIEPDGGILVAGSSGRGKQTRMVVARLLPDGKLDQEFGNGGYASIGCRAGWGCKAIRILVRPSGRILLAGSTTHQGSVGAYHEEPDRSRIALGQLLPNGRPDPGFGAKGLLLPPLGYHSRASTLALSGEDILIGGVTQTASGPRGIVARLRRDGRLDPGFAKAGVLRAFTRSTGVPIALFATAKRLIVVTAIQGFSGDHPAQSVLGFRANGTLDPGYRRLPTTTLMPRIISGPGAALQGERVILGWTQAPKKRTPNGVISLRLTGLAG
jgi:uncharacterized delta-60 repeat protein